MTVTVPSGATLTMTGGALPAAGYPLAGGDAAGSTAVGAIRGATLEPADGCCATKRVRPPRRAVAL